LARWAGEEVLAGLLVFQGSALRWMNDWAFGPRISLGIAMPRPKGVEYAYRENYVVKPFN